MMHTQELIMKLKYNTILEVTNDGHRWSAAIKIEKPSTHIINIIEVLIPVLEITTITGQEIHTLTTSWVWKTGKITN